MPVQSHGGGWRARKKHAGQWFIDPLRQTRLSWWSDIALAGVSGVGQKSTGAVVPLEEIKPRLKKMPVVWQTAHYDPLFIPSQKASLTPQRIAQTKFARFVVV